MPNVLSLFPFVCFWNFKLLEPPSLLKNKKHLVGILPRLQQAYVHLKIHSEEKFARQPYSSFKRKRNAKSTWIEHSMGRFQSRAAWVLVVLAWWRHDLNRHPIVWFSKNCWYSHLFVAHEEEVVLYHARDIGLIPGKIKFSPRII